MKKGLLRKFSIVMAASLVGLMLASAPAYARARVCIENKKQVQTKARNKKDKNIKCKKNTSNKDKKNKDKKKKTPTPTPTSAPTVSSSAPVAAIQSSAIISTTATTELSPASSALYSVMRLPSNFRPAAVKSYQISAGAADDDGVPHSAIFDGESLAVYEDTIDRYSYTNAVNEADVIVGSYGDTSRLFGSTTSLSDLRTQHGFVRENGKEILLENILPLNSGVEPMAINNAYVIVGAWNKYSNGKVSKSGFMYDLSKLTEDNAEPLISFSNFLPLSINDQNLVVGVKTGEGILTAAFYQNGNLTEVSDITGTVSTYSFSVAVNEKNDILVQAVDPIKALIIQDRGESVVEVPALGSDSDISLVKSMNSCKEVVGAVYNSEYDATTAFLWSPEKGTRDLNSLIPAGSVDGDIREALSINEYGQILVKAMNDNGVSSFYLITPTDRSVTDRCRA